MLTSLEFTFTNMNSTNFLYKYSYINAHEFKFELN